LAEFRAAFGRAGAAALDVTRLEDGVIKPVGARVLEQVGRIMDRTAERQDKLGPQSQAEVHEAGLRSLFGSAIAIGLAIAAAILISRSVARPVVRLTRVMDQLAAGDTTVAIPALARRDE